MMKPANLQLRDGTWHLVGKLDDSLDVSAFKAAGDGPVRLNLEGLLGMTSLGVRRFQEILVAAGERVIELHECPSVFVDMLNCAPGFLKPGRNVKVVSIYLPYTCEPCGLDAVPVLVKISEIETKGQDLSIPEKTCHQCRGKLEAAVDPYDYLLFLS